MGSLIPLFWTFGNVCPEFQSPGGSLWCDTWWPLGDQHCSQVFLTHVLPGNTSTNIWSDSNPWACRHTTLLSHMELIDYNLHHKKSSVTIDILFQNLIQIKILSSIIDMGVLFVVKTIRQIFVIHTLICTSFSSHFQISKFQLWK